MNDKDGKEGWKKNIEDDQWRLGLQLDLGLRSRYGLRFG